MSFDYPTGSSERDVKDRPDGVVTQTAAKFGIPWEDTVNCERKTLRYTGLAAEMDVWNSGWQARLRPGCSEITAEPRYEVK